MSFLDEVRFAIGRATDARERYATLQQGVAVLTDDRDVDAYLACYGEMHYYKLEDAISRIPFPTVANYPLEIWDWGCGVGIGAFSVLDELARLRIPTSNIFRVVLIDASSVMTSRAQSYMFNYYPHVTRTASIHIVNRELTAWPNALAPTAPFAVKLHILSNVLDIPGIDVTTFASNVAQSFTGLNWFILVSPSNNRTSDGFNRFGEVLAQRAISYHYADRNDPLRRSIYRLFPAGAYELFDITREERLINAVLN